MFLYFVPKMFNFHKKLAKVKTRSFESHLINTSFRRIETLLYDYQSDLFDEKPFKRNRKWSFGTMRRNFFEGWVGHSVKFKSTKTISQKNRKDIQKE